MTKALIIGGGIAGPVTAPALRKAGIDSVVFEAYPTGADDIGAFLTIMHNGLDALRAIDAERVVVDHSFAADGVDVYTGDGTAQREPVERRHHRPAHAAPRRPVPGAARRVAPARDRRRARQAAGRAGGRRPGGVRGRDDHRGGPAGRRGRAALRDPAAHRPGRAGTPLHGPEHLLRLRRGAGADDRARPVPHDRRVTRLFGHSTAPDGTTWWFARTPGPERHGGTPAEHREHAAAFFADDVAIAREIIGAEGEVHASNPYDVPTTPVWHTDRVVLVGDAAHAASPAAGQGASMALEDSVTLARCLRDLAAPRRAFEVYERLRRERVEALVEMSAGLGANRSVSANSFYAHHIEWNNPVQL